METGSFSQDTADSDTMETSGFSQEILETGSVDHLDNDNNDIVIIMRNNSNNNIIGDRSTNHLSADRCRQMISENGVNVTMAVGDQTYTSPSNVEVVALDVDATNVNWNNSNDANIEDDQGWGAVGQSSFGETSTSGDGTMMACYVCGDRASGYHYSVFSCEGCKGFFKRTVQKSLSYTCKDAGNCIINKFTRNSCQFCRFNKCLAMGMKKEAVREDRSPGGKHRHKRQRTDENTSLMAPTSVTRNYDVPSTASDFHDPLVDRLVAARPDRIPKAEHKSPGYDDKDVGRPNPLTTFIPEHVLGLQLFEVKTKEVAKMAKNPDIEDLKRLARHGQIDFTEESIREWGNKALNTSMLSVNDLMQFGYVELKFIIQWAKKVPGFHELEMVDQMALLKSSFMELNVFRLAFRSMGLENTIKFAENVMMTPEEVHTLGWGKELVNATIDFAVRLSEVNLDLTEFCILNAIVLTYPDAAGIQDKLQVMTMQSRMLDSLRRYMAHRFPEDHRRFGKMLLRLPALRTVSAKAAERFLSLTLDGSIQLNDLVLEMIN